MQRIVQALNAWRNRLSLGAQMALLTAVLCIVLVIACTTAATTIAGNQARARVESGMVTLAGFMAWRLDTFMDERYRDIHDLATLKPLSATWAGDADDIRTVLEDIQSSFPAYTWIGFAKPDGTVVAATGGMLEGVSVAERPWFQNGLEGPTVEDVHDAKLLAELLGPTESGEPFRFVDVAFPVYGPDGALIGVIGSHLSWTWAASIRDAMLELLDPSLRTAIWVLRADGRAVLGAPYDSSPLAPSVIEAINNGDTRPFIDETGEPMMMAAVRAGTEEEIGIDWIVVARRPVSTALASVNDLTVNILMAGLLLAVAGVFLAWRISLRVTHPLTALTRQVNQIGRDPTASISRERGSSDVLLLSSAVRSLLNRIGTAHEAQVVAETAASQLQERMDERTRTYGEHINALKQLADTDPLTHLLNRRAFLIFADDAMSYFRRYGRGIAVFVVDIDYFKRVNDTYGHGVGDDVIEAVGSAIAAQVRTTDKVARFGGEEFVVLLRETDSEGALTLAERIRETIADTILDARGHSGINVTVSIGLAMARQGDVDISAVIERADRALYEAKSSGRNRVISADEEPARISTAA